MKVEILGTGCVKCRLLEKRVIEVVKKMGRDDVKIVRVDDIEEIIKRGVMMTPALIIDGEVKVVGRVAGIKELKNLLDGKK